MIFFVVRIIHEFKRCVSIVFDLVIFMEVNVFEAEVTNITVSTLYNILIIMFSLLCLLSNTEPTNVVVTTV